MTLPQTNAARETGQEQATSSYMAVTVTEHTTGVHSVAVTHPCGHTFASQSRWNSDTAARRHGKQLLKCVCSTCRDRK